MNYRTASYFNKFYSVGLIVFLFSAAGSLAIALKWGFWDPAGYSLLGVGFAYFGKRLTQWAMNELKPK